MNFEEIQRALREHKLNWFDFAISHDVIQSHQDQWKPLIECKEFTQEQNGAITSRLSAAYGWIIQKEDRSPVLGPFDHRSIVRKIAAGEVLYSDFVWRPGMTSWQQVRECDDFAKRPKAAQKTEMAQQVASNPDEPAQAGGAVQSTPKCSAQAPPQERPAEAFGEDLTCPPSWLAFAIAAFLLISPIANRALAAATALQLVPLKLNSLRPSLAFQTDAAPGEVITVRLTARCGEVLDHLSLNRVFQVSRKAGEIPTLELQLAPLEGDPSGVLLPQGNYSVETRVGSALRNTPLFLGQKNENFNAQMVKFEKRSAGHRQNEKLALYYGSRDLRNLTRELERKMSARDWSDSSGRKEWQKFYQDWLQRIKGAEKTAAIEPDEFAEMAYADEFAEFHRAVLSLKKIASVYALAIGESTRTPAQSASVRLASEDEAAKLSGLKESFKNLRLHAVNLSWHAPAN